MNVDSRCLAVRGCKRLVVDGMFVIDVCGGCRCYCCSNCVDCCVDCCVACCVHCCVDCDGGCCS